ncbi:RsbRD N-terminal domain-containing protein [Chloroflexota bacterium]
MTLEHSLLQKKSAILRRWFHLIMETYPADSSRFLKQEKDRFANPVGYTISQEIKSLYEELLQNTNLDKISASLDSIIRIRSVQDYPPSQAIAFVFLLKKAIREELANYIGRNLDYEDLLKFEVRIDELALLALDIYTKCREKVHNIRLNEVKAEGERAFRLLEISNLIYEKPETEQSLENRENPLP